VKRLAALLGIVAGFLSAANARADGTIGFNPPMVIIDRAVDPPMFNMEMTVLDTVFLRFNAVNVVVGSNDGLELVDFTFNPALMGDLENVENPGPGVYLDDIKFGYFKLHEDTPYPGYLQESVDLGTLSVDTTGLPNGDYYILVDWEMDQGRSFLSTDFPGQAEEFLKGSALVRIVPEPATLSLLCLGFAGVALRRRRNCRS